MPPVVPPPAARFPRTRAWRRLVPRSPSAATVPSDAAAPVPFGWGFAVTAALFAFGCASTPARPITKLVSGRVIVTRSVSGHAYEHAARAMVYEGEDRWEEAAAEYQRAIAYDADAPELHARLGEAFLALDRAEDAEAEIARSLKLETTVDGLMAQAHLRQRRGRQTDAIAALEAATAQTSFGDDPDQAERVHLELADARLAALNTAGAGTTLEALCSAASWSVTARLRAAGVAWALGDTTRAEARLREALALEPAQVEALLQLAWLHAALGKEAEARETFAQALERSERSLEVAVAYARYLVGRGALDEARQLADDLAGPDVDEDSVADRMELERTVRRPDRALAVAAALRKEASDQAKDRLPLAEAVVLEDAGRHEDAVKAYLSVPHGAATFREARLQAAAVLRDQGKTGGAIKLLDEVSTNSSGSKSTVDVAIARSLVDEKLGDPTRAARRLDEVATDHPSSARLAMARAALEDRRGDWRRALAIAGEVIAREPTNAEALNFWGFVAVDHDHAVALATRRLMVALALEPGSAAILDSLGWASFRSRDPERAAVFLEQARRLSPDDPEILGHLAVVRDARADKGGAVALLREALELKSEAPVRRRLEEQLRRLDARDAAGR